jgi:hypothetical protein
MQLIWHGTQDEYSDLIQAVARNCACDSTGARAQVPCGAHWLLHEQRTVDRLVFARRIFSRLARGEHDLASTPIHPMLTLDGERSNG